MKSLMIVTLVFAGIVATGVRAEEPCWTLSDGSPICKGDPYLNLSPIRNRTARIVYYENQQAFVKFSVSAGRDRETIEAELNELRVNGGIFRWVPLSRLSRKVDCLRDEGRLICEGDTDSQGRFVIWAVFENRWVKRYDTGSRVASYLPLSELP